MVELKILAELHKQIMQQRERILEAFIAETGCLPSECEQITQDHMRWFVRRREGDNLIEKSQYQTIRILEAEVARLREEVERLKQYEFMYKGLEK